MLLNRKVGKLTFCAMLAANSLLLLLLGGFVPSLKLSFAAFAGILPAAAVLSCGLMWGVLTWLATSVLGLLLLPQRTIVLIYFLFLGHYPVLKSLLERLPNRLIVLALKLVVFWALLSVFYFGLRKLFLTYLSVPFGMAALLYLGGGLAFFAYDYAFSLLITFYSKRILPKLSM